MCAGPEVSWRRCRRCTRASRESPTTMLGASFCRRSDDRAWEIATVRRCDAGDEATGIACQQLSALAAFSGCPMVLRDESSLSDDVPVHQICDQRGTSIWLYIDTRDG